MLIVEASINITTGEPEVRIYLHRHDDDGELLDIDPIFMSAGEARTFGINLAITAIDTESNAGYMTGMRALKIPDETINDVITEAETITLARRRMFG